MAKKALWPALAGFIALAALFLLLSQAYAKVWIALLCYQILLLPGILVVSIVTGNPHDFGTGTVLLAFGLDYCVLLALLRQREARRSPAP